MNITKFAILKKMFGGGGGAADHTAEDGLITGTATDYSNDRVTNIENFAFYYNTSLKNVSFANATSIGVSAFEKVETLKAASFPNATTVREYAFRNDTSLETIFLPKVTTIANRAFQTCKGLDTIDLPCATSIGVSAFESCGWLETLILRNNQVCSLGTDGLYSTHIIGFGYIYVPSALVEDYKTAKNWSTYASRFRALEDYTVDGTTTGALDPTKTET